MWTFLTALITGLSAASVAISAQWITSFTALRVKNLEILFVKKADAYKQVLERAWEFGTSPDDAEKFLALRNSIYAALIVASKDVADALDDHPRANLHMTVVLLKSTAATRPEQIPSVQMNQWREAMERIKSVMRTDMAGLSESPRIRDLLRL